LKTRPRSSKKQERRRSSQIATRERRWSAHSSQLCSIASSREILTLLERVNRGVTLLKAEGAYSGADQKMILCAVRRDETFRLRQLVFEIDPDAFFMMLSTDEVRGYRWLDPHEN